MIEEHKGVHDNEEEYVPPLPPPYAVFCVGRSESAAVWWMVAETVDIDSITAWEVLRFRRDDDSWKLKGVTQTTSSRVNHCVLTGLSNGFEYRFTVRAKGGPVGDTLGDESEPSNVTIAEKPLPSGWFRFSASSIQTVLSSPPGSKEAAQRRYYYANIKTKQATWTRPDEDPYFLSESVYAAFNAMEHKNLRHLYDDEMANMNKITIDGCRDALLESGEKASRKFLSDLFKAYSGNLTELTSFVHFMQVCAAVKAYNHSPRLGMLQAVWTFCSRHVRIAVGQLLNSKAAVAGSTKKERMGTWTLEWNELAGKYYFFHPDTQEVSWEMPDEVRFYIEPKYLHPKIISLFEFNNVERLVMLFSQINVDCSGLISEPELKMFLRKLKLMTSSNDIHRYFTSLDVECEGKISFNDVCLLLSYLVTRNKKQALPIVLRTLENGLNSASSSANNSPSRGKLIKVEFSGIDSSAGGSVGSSADGSDDDEYNSDEEESDGSDIDKEHEPAAGNGDGTDRNSFQGTSGDRLSRRTKKKPSGGRRAWLRCCGSCCGRSTAYQVHPGGPEEVPEPSLPIEETVGHHPTDCMCGCRRVVEIYDNGG